MNELIQVNYDNDRPTVLARDLHEFLEVQTLSLIHISEPTRRS